MYCLQFYDLWKNLNLQNHIPPDMHAQDAGGCYAQAKIFCDACAWQIKHNGGE